MVMTVKVGDWVVSLVDEHDLVKGNEYKVGHVYGSTSISVIDDAGDEHCLLEDEYKTITKPETSSNYNDGKWHGWNGGECPVYPNTVVETVWVNGDCKKGVASRWKWRVEGQIQYMIAFRVIKEHREPREWWLQRLENGALVAGVTEVKGAIKVREVIE
jgi:hypothetical protein